VNPAGQTANVLGALALAVSDQTAGAVAAATGQSPSAVSALSALAGFLDRPSLDDLRRVLGLTPSGAVRLVDRLAEAGLVSRETGQDGRSRAVVLTPAGRRLAERIAAIRLATLESLLDGLDDAEHGSLRSLLGRVMAAVVNGKDGGAWICRQCDLTACRRADGQCPAALAAQQKYGGKAAARVRR